jgi:hypothetical protein
MCSASEPTKNNPPNVVPLMSEADTLKSKVCSQCNYLVNNICLVPHTNYCGTAEKIQELLSEEKNG